MTVAPLSLEGDPVSTPTEWQPLATMPKDREVWTAIIDASGTRNIQKLRKSGNMLWAGDMYVYYTPTHWAEEPTNGR